MAPRASPAWPIGRGVQCGPVTPSLGWERRLTFPDVSASQLRNSPSLCVSDFLSPANSAASVLALWERQAACLHPVRYWACMIGFPFSISLILQSCSGGEWVVDRKDEQIFIIDPPASKGGQSWEKRLSVRPAVTVRAPVLLVSRAS